MRLRHSTSAQDDASEAQATNFIQGSSPDAETTGVTGREVDEFTKEFKKMRKAYHKRAMWNERWQAGDVAWPENR
jgi:ESCRT-I complex subunit VPS37